MLQNNALLKQLKEQISHATPRIEGVVKATDKGFGFIEKEDHGRYFVQPYAMRRVLHGDRVTARLYTLKGQTVAEPEKLLSSVLTRFVGQLQKREHQWIVIPDQPLLKQPIFAIVDSTSLYQEGDWVVATLRDHPLNGAKNFQAQIIEHISSQKDCFAFWWVALARHQLARTSPSDALFSPAVDEADRIDLTELPFFTIDNATTQDIDDALAVDANPDGSFTLFVAIADPTAYIPPDSLLDKTARQRAFTHYLPGLNIPMLPPCLSEDHCSLQAGVKRPALVCKIVITPTGALRNQATFMLAWITSQAKFSYTDVSQWLEGNSDWHPDSPILAQQLQRLQQAMQARTQWREQHALLFKDRTEYRFILDKQGQVVDIVAEKRLIAHRMVEEAMVAANLCAALLLRDRLGYGIFSTHAGLENQQLQSILTILSTYGAPFKEEEMLFTLDGFCALRRYADAQPTAYLAERLRRCQALSMLSVKPAPHFGLGLPVYATWTSPLRKYGDMVNHRLLKAMIAHHSPPAPPDGSLITHLNEQRRKQRIAERQITDWLYACLLQDKVATASPLEAEVIDVTRGGLRVRLLTNGAIAFLPNSLLHPIREELCYQSEHAILEIKGRCLYRLGDSVQVILHTVHLEKRDIIVKLAAAPAAACIKGP